MGFEIWNIPSTTLKMVSDQLLFHSGLTFHHARVQEGLGEDLSLKKCG